MNETVASRSFGFIGVLIVFVPFFTRNDAGRVIAHIVLLKLPAAQTRVNYPIGYFCSSP
jgi:hypothetical protein